MNNELYHYGVKGMKWGVRRYQNADGSLTPAGKKRTMKRFAKDFYKQSKRDGDSYKAKVKFAESDAISAIHNTKELSSARQKYRDAMKLERDYYNNPKLLDKYQRVAANAAAQKYGRPYKEMLNGYKYDDLDQGENSSFHYYLKSKGKSHVDYEREVSRAAEEYSLECKRATAAVLEEYGKTPVSVIVGGKKRKTTVDKVVESALDYRGMIDVYSDDEKRK